MLPNSGPSACHPKTNTQEANVGTKKRLLYSGGQYLGEEADSCPNAVSLLPISEKELLKGNFRGGEVDGGGSCRKAQAALMSSLN